MRMRIGGAQCCLKPAVRVYRAELRAWFRLRGGENTHDRMRVMALGANEFVA